MIGTKWFVFVFVCCLFELDGHNWRQQMQNDNRLILILNWKIQQSGKGIFSFRNLQYICAIDLLGIQCSVDKLILIIKWNETKLFSSDNWYYMISFKLDKRHFERGSEMVDISKNQKLFLIPFGIANSIAKMKKTHSKHLSKSNFGFLYPF